MRHRLNLTFSALLVPLDFLALFGAAMTGYALRFSKAFTDIRPILTAIPFSEYLGLAVAFSLVWIVIFALAGLYSTRPRKAWNEFGRIIVASTAGMMVVIASIFFGREFTASRFLVLAMWGFAIVFVALGRLVLRLIRYAILNSGYAHQRLALIGSGKTAQALAEMYKQRPILGVTLVKTYKQWTDATARDLEKLAVNHRIDGILLADPDMPREHSFAAISLADDHHLTIRYIADVFSARVQRIDISTEGGIPVLEVKRNRLDGWGRIFKRIFDIVASILLLIILSPIMIITAIAIKLDSRGTILFSRLPGGAKVMRVGEGGRPFHYFKFRSMRMDEHFKRYTDLAHLNTRQGPLVKTKDDPRITRVGHLIRKFSIDELPELFLVLAGKMSLVGPRPHYPEEVANYQHHHRQVMAVKPGITGMAQISGRSNLDFEDEVRLDTWYIDNWTPLLDLYIILKTPFVVLSRKGAG